MKPRIDLIMRTVCDHCGVDVDDMLSPDRTAHMVHARQTAMYLCRKLTGKSTTFLGDAFNKHHTTVVDACRSVESRLASDPEYADEMGRLEKLVAGKSRLRGAGVPGLLDRPSGDWDTLSFAYMRSVNLARCLFLHDRDGVPIGDWTMSDWGVAAAGEIGEMGEALAGLLSSLVLANQAAARAGKAWDKAKKIKRLDGPYHNKPDDQDRDKLLQELASEMADSILYMDLLAATQGIDLGRAIVDKFNEKSRELGVTHRLMIQGADVR